MVLGERLLQADEKGKVAMEVQRHESRVCLENRGLTILVGEKGRVKNQRMEMGGEGPGSWEDPEDGRLSLILRIRTS